MLVKAGIERYKWVERPGEDNCEQKQTKVEKADQSKQRWA